MQTENPKDPRSIQELMGENTLGNIIKKAQILDKINRALYDLLTPEIRETTQVLNLKDNCLVLASSNSAIATRVRYQEEELIRAINRLDGVPEILRIDCVVRPGQ